MSEVEEKLHKLYKKILIEFKEKYILYKHNLKNERRKIAKLIWINKKDKFIAIIINYIIRFKSLFNEIKNFCNPVIPISIIFCILYIPLILLYYFNTKLFINLDNVSNIQSILGVFIGVIGTIIGITFSILLVNIQSVSNNFSGGAYKVITNRKEPLYTFLVLFILEFLLVINFLNTLNIDIYVSAFFSTFFFFTSLYVLWDFYIWVKVNLSISCICTFLGDEFSNSIDKSSNNTGEELFDLLEVHSRLLDKRFIKDSYKLFDGFKQATIKFIKINIDNANLASFMHNNIYMVLNRGTVDSILQKSDYQGLNNIIDFYGDILKIGISSTKKYNGENNLLSLTLSQFNELSEKIIKNNQDEAIYRSLRIMQTIAPLLLESPYYINFSTFLDGLSKYGILERSSLKGILIQEYIKVYIFMLYKIIQKGEKIDYLLNTFDNILSEVKMILLYKSISPKIGIDISNDLLYNQVFDFIRRINLQYINKILDSNDRFVRQGIRKLLEEFVEGLEFYRQNKVQITDYLHIRYFCEMMLNMLEDEIKDKSNTNFYLYFKVTERLCYIAIDMENGRELHPINEYLIKIFGLIVEYGLDDYNVYLKFFEKLINEYKERGKYKGIEGIYKNLSLVCVLISKNNKEVKIFKDFVNIYEVEQNIKMKEGYDGDPENIKHFLYPITNFLLSNYNNFDKFKREVIFSGINLFFDEWFIRRFSLTKEDFGNYLGVKD